MLGTCIHISNICSNLNQVPIIAVHWDDFIFGQSEGRWYMHSHSMLELSHLYDFYLVQCNFHILKWEKCWHYNNCLYRPDMWWMATPIHCLRCPLVSTCDQRIFYWLGAFRAFLSFQRIIFLFSFFKIVKWNLLTC